MAAGGAGGDLRKRALSRQDEDRGGNYL